MINQVARPIPTDPDTVWNAFERFIKSRPGMDPRNYDRAGYAADSRLVTKQRREALALLQRCKDRAHYLGIDADALGQAMFAHSGRLTWELKTRTWSNRKQAAIPCAPHWALDYCAGQYYCTEYRAAAAAVLGAYLDYTN